MAVSRTGSEAKGKGRVLATRIVSALVLAVPVLGAVVFGPPATDVLVAVVAVVLAWEWCRMCIEAGERTTVHMVAMVAVPLAAVEAMAFGHPNISFAAMAAGAVIVAVVSPSGSRAWLAAGTVYISLPCVAFVWLRADPDWGRATTLWLLAVVWASDVGGYAFGRTIGGPRLAPVLSPNKTWAGFFGAVVSAGLAGFAAAGPIGVDSPVRLAVASAALGATAQMGDLAESSVKRHFGVKDAGTLIPGHGGLLDRVDALLVVVAVTALISVVGGGSILAWL